MSEASAIKALTLNIKTVFQTTAAIDRVKINNNSSFYLRVYFGADAPTNATDPGWHDTIDPGDKPLLGVVGASASAFTDRTNYIQSTPYLGTITIMPFLPAGGPLASGGIVSGGAFCHLTGYYPGEYADTGTGDEAYVQAAKQGRYMAPTGAVERYITSVANTDASANFATASGAAFFTLTPARCPGLFAWAEKVNGTAQDIININVHYYGIVADWGNTAAGAASCVWRIEAVIRNAADTVDKVFETLGLYRFGSAAAVVAGEHLHDQPPHPALITLSLFGPGLGGPGLVSGDIFKVRYVRLASAGTWETRMNTDVLVDELNQSGYMDRPYLPVVYASPSDAPYDANGNPQTW